MSQFMRPNANVTQTNWTGGYAEIDESSYSDTDFAYSTNNTAGATLEVGLTDPSTPASGTCTVRYRHAQADSDATPPVAPSSGGTATQVTCYVYEGATLRVTDTQQTANAGSFVERSFTFNTSLISSWSDVRLRWVTAGGGGATANRRGVAISWAEIEIPDAGGTVNDRTGTDTLSVADSLSRLMQWVRRYGDDLSVSDPRPLFTFNVMANDVLALLDNATGDYIPYSPAGTINTLTETDGVTLSDSLLSVRLSWRTMGDVIAIADADQLRRICTLLDTGAVDVADSVLRSSIRGRITADGLVVVDTGGRQHVFDSMATDALVALDAFTADYVPATGGGPQTYTRTPTDYLLIADGEVRARLAAKAVEDAVALADAALVSRLRNLRAEDGTSLLDDALEHALRRLLASDSVAVADDVRRYSVRGLLASDFASVTDAAFLRTLLFRIVTESLSLTDEGITGRARALILTVTDEASLTDAAVLRRVLWREAGDYLQALDYRFATSLRQAVVSDAVAILDQSLLQRQLTRLLTDSFGMTDGAVRAAYLTRAVEDALALADSALSLTTGLQLRVASDGVELSDGTQKVLLSRRVLTDGFDTSDDTVRMMRLLRSIADGLTVSDDFDAIKSAMRIVSLTHTDTLLVNDVADLFRVRNRDIVGLALELTDAASLARALGRQLTDTAIVTDTAALALRRILLGSDELQVADGVGMIRFTTKQLLDFVGVTDDAWPLYLSDISLRFLLRVQLGSDPVPVVGTEEVVVLGYDPLKIELGGLQ